MVLVKTDSLKALGDRPLDISYQELGIRYYRVLCIGCLDLNLIYCVLKTHVYWVLSVV